MTALAHPLDIGIFVIFLAVTLVVGLNYGRSVKTLKDYALGGNNFSTATLVATIVATWITGAFLTWRIDDIYHNGLYAIILYLCDIGTLVLTGWVFAVRMGPFLKNTSIAEAMGTIYGRPVRTITAIFSLLVSIGLVALQFKTGEKVFSMLLGWDSVHTQIIIGSIIIVYSAFGGIRAVTFTDILQFFAFGTLIPMLALVIWNNTHDADSVLRMFQEVPNFNIKALLTSSSSEKRWSLLTLIPLYLIPAFSPPIFQRAIMAKNVHQIRRAFLYSSLVCFILLLFIVWIAILIRTQDGDLAIGDVFPHIVKHYTSLGMTGLLLAGLMAMIMSTADSNLNAAAVIFADEIIGPMMVSRRYSLLKLVQSDSNQLIIARVGSVIMGLLALLFALNADSYIYSKIVLGAWSYYMPVVSVPLLLAILGFRTSTRAVLIGVVAGFTTVYLQDYFFVYTSIDSSLPGMLANLLGLMGSHYLLGEKGGWQKLAPSSPLALERAARRQAWQRRLRAARRFQLYPYLQQNLPTQEGFYFFFGLYTMAATYAALYTIGDVDVKTYQDLYKGIYYTVLPAATAFLTFPVWPLTMKNRRFMTFFWPLGIGGILFFAGTLLVIMSHFHHMQVMVMMINLLMAVLLLHWPLALFLAFSGTALAVFFFQNYTGTPLPAGELVGSLQLRIIYGLLLLTSFLIALFKGKQAYKELSTSYEQLRGEKAASSEELIAALHHREHLVQEVATDKVHAIATIRQMRQQLDEDFKHATTKEQLSAVNKNFQAALDKLHVLTEHLDQVTHQTQGYMRLEVDTVSVQALLHDVFEVLDKQDKKLLQQVLTQQHSTCQEIQVDKKKLKQLLVESLCYAQQSGEQPIVLAIQDTTLGYPITSIQGHIKEVSALCFTITTESTLPMLRPLYMVSVDRAAIRLPQTTAELTVMHNQQIAEAHYGTSELIEHAQSMTQLYVIPVNVREVRPQTMDLLSNTEVISDTTVYPEEVAFVQEVTKKTQINGATLQKALQLIKQYHAGVKRKSGEPFYLHPIAVAQILLDYTQDQDTLIAALLHDTVEDTRLSLNQIVLHFNPEVQRIVDGVTHLDSNLQHAKRIQLSAHENIQQLLEVEDDRILYVKLADRLHNMRTIAGHPSLAKQKKIAEETLQFFVPMARSLDLKPIAEELQKRCFVVLNRK